ncbi:uncharacterized protein LOC119680702 [Teleopsis dalmanni]|uniref:uncharacterized protein LOC119680702 n=1 Tax=Teleopsis dalmanni TaxID=139649 RepID=UPI0018CCF678|nr:uncharacterized protein LOC119680702 [Teleopsis dalmanni]
MGCNTSQELKTKDGAIAINGEEVSNTSPVENFEQQTQNGNVHSNEQQQKGGVIGGDHNSVGVDDDNVTANTQIKSGNSHKHHTKSSSIISNGDANKHSKDAKIVFDSSSASPQKPFSIYKENGIATLNGDGQLRQYGRAEISELNDMELGEDEEVEVDIRIPHHHHHHGSKKIRRNPLKNLDLDFKFDVNSF